MTVYKTKQILYLEYETFDREKHVETLICDTTTFLTQVGGNLGLFLGISCLSVILTIIDFFRNGKNILVYC
jgi:Amiloride-sensitive sodium channel